MDKVLKLTQDPNCVLDHDGCNISSESAVESGFTLSNGFLEMRADHSIKR